MADPTGLQSYLVGKLIDKIIKEAKLTINFREHVKSLESLLIAIRPLVQEAEANLAREDGSCSLVKEPRGAVKWLKDLEDLLKETYSLIQQCNKTTFPVYDVISNNKMSTKIVDYTKKIQEVIAFQAPLANLSATGDLSRKLSDIQDTLLELEQKLNRSELGVTTQRCLELEGMTPQVAFSEIRSRNDKLTATRLYQENRTLLPSTSQDQQQPEEREDYDIRQVPDFIFAIDEPLTKLQGLLVGEGMRWVGVWGKGGIGKTLLVELAYNSKVVQDHFDIALWLTLGRNPSVARLQHKLCRMMNLLIQEKYESNEDCKQRLRRAFLGKKTLLVLDDVWEDDGVSVIDWLDVTQSDSSKTLVTTRDMQVLRRKQVADDATVRMEHLSDEDSWALFCTYAFNGADRLPSSLPQKLVRDVATECKGLPLALKVIAGAQAGERSIQNWERALNKLKEAEALNLEHEIQVYKRLQLSYDALTSLHFGDSLQKCFIYFAAFPEDEDVDQAKLIGLWSGEKLIESTNDGYYLLGVLISRSLIDVQNPRWSHTANSKQKTCRIHDVLRDLALYLVHNHNARMGCLFNAGRGLSEFPNTWLVPSNPRFLDRLAPGPRPSSLQGNPTHLSLNDNFLERLQTKLRVPSLEVLLLSNNKKLTTLSPGFFESFSNLKVLDLSDSAIESLPNSVGKLKNLILLDLSRTSLRALPKTLRNLVKLETLNLQTCRIQAWPIDVSCLRSLSSLNTRGCDIWKSNSGLELGIGCLKRSTGVASQLVSLCSLTLLWSVSISTDHISLPKEMSSLTNLTHLSLYCNGLVSLPPELHQDNDIKLSKLVVLCLDHCLSLSELPSWMESLSQLQNLNLVSCRSLRSLPDLHKLPRLLKLDISMCSRLEQLPDGFTSRGAFPALKELYMMNCGALSEFPPVEEGALPELTDLDLTDCRSLQTLPSSLRIVPNLMRFTLSRCMGLQSIDSCFRDLITNIAQGNDPIIPYFRKLEELKLQGLKLKNLPESLAGCPALKKIYLPKENTLIIPENLQLLQDQGKLNLVFT